MACTRFVHLGLTPVHGLVGVVDEFLLVGPVKRVGGDSEGSRHGDVRSLRQRNFILVESIAETLDDRGCLISVGLRQSHHEFVSTKTENLVASTELLLKNSCNSLDDFASREVPVTIIDVLEVIQIYEKDG